MSWLPTADEPDALAAVDVTIEPSVKDLGSFRVRRALPSQARQMVGPFIFLDHMGPARFEAGEGMDVRPHPHIRLATVTYLLEGSIVHRDTLGSVQEIVPGAVNWMTAGRGVAHSERTGEVARSTPREVQGIQSWVALPRSREEDAPGFSHHPGDTLPVLRDRGITARVIAGEAYGTRSPVPVASHTLYVDASLDAGAILPLSGDHAERGVYVIEGEVEVAGEGYAAGRLLLFRPGDAVALRALRPSRVLLIGGEPMDGPRHVWWNFVHSRKDRIEAAKEDWRAGRFAFVPGDEREFIPLPG